ncbi:hypothetical protein PPERSA_03745 [Pseudocohnilembus persalinus]|uniref:Uncharacterized protein n=1 Tax=Pseudocohnilembus persalinus TaxID=266149 RepID=A0A0V0QHD2_PSEPJ|nr:hypothetical protein PPERSA_03745 [Pseudocohnilembus persalinus]|eukprot:KRX01661.1 hypothetical protein PPERSA_03745 [Pseudocohnilembus persalinus]
MLEIKSTAKSLSPLPHKTPLQNTSSSQKFSSNPKNSFTQKNLENSKKQPRNKSQNAVSKPLNYSQINYALDPNDLKASLYQKENLQKLDEKLLKYEKYAQRFQKGP